jgi:NAD dependent epimerase/dehydratase
MNQFMNNLLVTGADGFIGSHLTQLLLHEGYNVKALVQYNSFNSWGWLEDLTENPNLKVIMGDVRDPFFCESLCSEVDTIFHLAALIAIPYSYHAPQSYFETNLNGTINICQAAIKNKCRHVVVTSTSEVYGTAQYIPINELHPKQPQSPYSASKIAADAAALSYYHSFGLPVTIARPFNTYGPRQSARAIIPTIITQLTGGSHEVFLGNVTPTRDLNYVTDTCLALLAIARNPEKTIGEELNIATSREFSIGEIFNLIKQILHSDACIKMDNERVRPDNSEVFRLCGDNSKLKALTGFENRISFEEGLKHTCDWFSIPDNQQRYKHTFYTL